MLFGEPMRFEYHAGKALNPYWSTSAGDGGAGTM